MKSASLLPRVVVTLGLLLVARTPAGAQSLPNASIDLAHADVNHGLTRLDVGDGMTVPAEIGNLTCRRNENPSRDSYMYFDVDNGLSFQGSQPRVFLFFHYFDSPGVSFTVQYDSLSEPYKTSPVLTTTGTNTWKVHSIFLGSHSTR